MVHMAIKVERQINLRGATKYMSDSSSSMRLNWRKEEKLVPKEIPKGKDEVSAKPKEEGESLVTRRALNFQVKKDDMEQKREIIFRTRCLINNKVCNMIIDGGSCTNVASNMLIENFHVAVVE